MTEYSKYINDILKPKIREEAVVLDLFAGCGGLSLGFEAAGFKTIGFEMVNEAVATYNKNLRGDCYNQFLEVGYEYPMADNIDIVIGGPPCQPFSRFGNQMGIEDARDGFLSLLMRFVDCNQRCFYLRMLRTYWADTSGILI